MLYQITSSLHDAEFCKRLYNSRVFLRADLNVPLHDGTIAHDFRLHALIPTLNVLRTSGARTLIATHIGRPTHPDPSLSTKVLISWFEKQGYSIQWAATIQQAHDLMASSLPGTLILLENLRFFKGEYTQDNAFAQSLRELGNIYISDAFGTMHRADTSLTVLALLFSSANKSIGLLVEQELSALNSVKSNSARPVVLIVGGGKVKTKLPLLYDLLDLIDICIPTPALVFTLLKAQGHPVGESIVADDQLETAAKIIKKAEAKQIQLIFPRDYLVSENILSGPIHETTSLAAHDIGLAMGVHSIEAYAPILATAGTIILNGAIGVEEQPASILLFKTLLQTIASSDAYTLIGGGDSVSTLEELNLVSSINFCSTGGGSMLTYLANRPLPGVEALIR